MYWTFHLVAFEKWPCYKIVFYFDRRTAPQVLFEFNSLWQNTRFMMKTWTQGRHRCHMILCSAVLLSPLDSFHWLLKRFQSIAPRSFNFSPPPACFHSWTEKKKWKASKIWRQSCSFSREPLSARWAGNSNMCNHSVHTPKDVVATVTNELHLASNGTPGWV